MELVVPLGALEFEWTLKTLQSQRFYFIGEDGFRMVK